MPSRQRSFYPAFPTAVPRYRNTTRSVTQSSRTTASYRVRNAAQLNVRAGSQQVPIAQPQPQKKTPYTQWSGPREDWGPFDDMVEDKVAERADSFTRNLDNVLIFAALFSAVNVTALSFSLPLLAPDEAANSSTLLAILVQQNMGINPNSTDLLPSTAHFSPPFAALLVNQLFTASLTCSLLAAFGAAIAQQWVLFYRKGPRSGVAAQRWNRQAKIYRVNWWHLEDVVQGVFPTAIQISVFAFIAGLIIFLYTTTPITVWPTAALCGASLAAYLISVGLTFWDPYCPFETTLSALCKVLYRWLYIPWAFLHNGILPIIAVVFHYLGRIVAVAEFVICLCAVQCRGGAVPSRPAMRSPFRKVPEFILERKLDLGSTPGRRSDKEETLKGKAMAWVFNTTEKEKTLKSVALNLVLTTSPVVLSHFAAARGDQALAYVWKNSTANLREFGDLSTHDVGSRIPDDKTLRDAVTTAALYSRSCARVALTDTRTELLRRQTPDTSRTHDSLWAAVLAVRLDAGNYTAWNPFFALDVGLLYAALMSHWASETYAQKYAAEATLFSKRWRSRHTIVAQFYPILSLKERKNHRDVQMVAMVLAWLPCWWQGHLTNAKRPRHFVQRHWDYNERMKSVSIILSSGKKPGDGQRSMLMTNLTVALGVFCDLRSEQAQGFPVPPMEIYAELLRKATPIILPVADPGRCKYLIAASARTLRSLIQPDETFQAKQPDQDPDIGLFINLIIRLVISLLKPHTLFQDNQLPSWNATLNPFLALHRFFEASRAPSLTAPDPHDLIEGDDLKYLKNIAIQGAFLPKYRLGNWKSQKQQVAVAEPTEIDLSSPVGDGKSTGWPQSTAAGHILPETEALQASPSTSRLELGHSDADAPLTKPQERRGTGGPSHRRHLRSVVDAVGRRRIQQRQDPPPATKAAALHVADGAESEWEFEEDLTGVVDSDVDSEDALVSRWLPRP